MKKFILFIILFGLAVGILGFWYWNRNTYSKADLKLEILGPEEVSPADEVEYTVRYKNNGNIKLEDPYLIFEFPKGAVREKDVPKRVEIKGEKLGSIYPGEEKIFKFKCHLLGKEGEVKVAKVWLNYKPKNLKARYESSTTFATKIKSVPITLDFDLSSKMLADKVFKFSVNYFSNLDYPLTNLGIKMEYPSGFEFIESNPRTISKTEWDIPVLNKAEGGRIEITGKLSGEVREKKIFRAVIGFWEEDNSFIPIKEVKRAVEITNPRLYVFQEINGQSNYVAKPGDLLHYEIYFRNVGDEPFKNLFLVSSLKGKAFDFDSIQVLGGQANKEDGSIIWDWRDVPKLHFLNQGEEGKVEFWVKLKDYQISGPYEKNPTLKNTVLISQVKEEFETKISTKLVITQKAFYNDEIFGSSGPLPPEVGKETMYTIVWEAKNYYNDAKNVKVKATLPKNVRLTGKIFPKEETSNFSFDSKSREIVWSIGDDKPMMAGTGIFMAPARIAFQVALKPTKEQEGKIVPLIGQAVISGEDQWTEKIVQSTTSGIKTDLPDDPGVTEKQGRVKKSKKK